MISMILFLPNNHYIISSHNDIFNVAESLVEFLLEDIPCDCNTEGHDHISESSCFCIECG